MTRGGRREGSGGKPAWKHGKTKPVRVPIALADKILEIARILDATELEEINLQDFLEQLKHPRLVDLSGITIRFVKDGPAVYLADLVKAGYEIKPTQLVRNLKPESSLASLKRQVDQGIEQLKRLEK